MPSHPLRRPLSTLLALVALGTAAAPAQAAPGLEATFQDDPLLVYGTPETVSSTLDRLRALGVDRLRVSVFWRVVAPANSVDEQPSFDPTNPGAYDPTAWDRYDRLVREAAARGIGVNLNVTSPAPDWATATPEREDIDDVFAPDPRKFGDFVRAVGTRYSGHYVPTGQSTPLPRVRYWSAWNEPNQGAWLAPQWIPDPRAPERFIEASPHHYRALVDQMWLALRDTGHGNDTFLIGETAPKGVNKVGETRQMKPARFIRQLYCLDENLQFLRGTSAELRGCPTSDVARRMAEDHPALFKATGYAHHPYELTFAPDRRPTDRDFLTIANLKDLSALLRRIYQRYGQPIPGGRRDVPLYLTEFGYQTDPPDPLGVSEARQAAFLNQAEHLAFRNPNVRTLAQFLLVDDGPLPGVDRGTAEAWGSSFQSGLVGLDGAPKRAFSAYRFPLWLPRRTVAEGGRLTVWGRPRPAGARSVKVRVEVRTGSKGRWRLARTVATRAGAHGALETRVRVTRSGAVRLRWNGLTSRAVSFRVR